MQKLDAAVHPDERHSCIRLLSHIYVVDRFFVSHLSGVTHGYSTTNTPETARFANLHAAVAATDRWYTDYLARLEPERLEESVRFTFTDGTQATMTREEMLGHVLIHGGYHRGAVGRILAQVSAPRRATCSPDFCTRRSRSGARGPNVEASDGYSIAIF